jgi:carbamoyltransferase
VLPGWLRHKLHVPREIRRSLSGRFRRRPLFAEHHESHAASAFYPSPFDEAAILTFDGVGEWATASFGSGRGNRIELTHELRFPHSLGMLYSACTAFCGFEVNSGEYKLMGLAPYGVPKYAALIREKLLDLKDDGSFRLDMRYFRYGQGLCMTSPAFHALLDGQPRHLAEPITEREMDLAASIQAVTEDIVLRAARHVHQQTGLKNLCLAGGVALNSVANGRLLREGPFENLWIQPAAGDAGGAIGAALLMWHHLLGNPRTPEVPDSQQGSLLGPAASDADAQRYLDSVGGNYSQFESDDELCEHVAKLLAEGKVVGWVQGRMEFGPRALGNRSILADSRNESMQAVLNQKVKFRESFRPFGPAVLAEHAGEYFEIEPGQTSPYMLQVAPVHASQRISDESKSPPRGLEKLGLRRSTIPAVTHVDHSARLQTVDERHGRFRLLLERFHAQTGCPVLINTSFNVRDEPLVCTPADAYRCFQATDVDVLVLGRCVVSKPPAAP